MYIQEPFPEDGQRLLCFPVRADTFAGAGAASSTTAAGSSALTYPVDGICYTALSRGGQIRRFCTDLKTGARKNTKPV